MKKSVFFSTVFVLITNFLSLPEVMASDWTLVYKHDKQGEVISGDKQQLIAAIRSGASIRIGWGRAAPDGRSVEHTAIPEFLTITDESEVFLQIPEHIAQTSYWNNDLQDFNSPQEVWKGLFSTTGRFMAVWYNRATGATVRRVPQRVPISWFAQLSKNTNQQISPLFDTKSK